MDEEFTLPGNVDTEYRLFGMAPRHLRRAVLTLPLAAVAAVLTWRAPLWLQVALTALVATVDLGLRCYPVFPGGATMWDKLRQLREHATRPAHFPPPVFANGGEEITDADGPGVAAAARY